ncbi:S-layer homology domain-containing protein [Acutalibacter muris]|uniref:S-layer homology domain-containing protein n=1 Tax=Acutalibacter muris TaxID=1796620 RepID=UPI00272EB214|nr:S-layer homology domain-containing protein [Acutalibacter muris]
MRIKKTISLGLTLVLALSLITPALAAPAPARTVTPKVVCAANGRSPFSDVPSTHWGIDGILAAYNDGVMTGTYFDASTGERQFSPAAPLTMAEWTVMIYRAFYADEPYAVAQESWWNREADILNRHGIYAGWGSLSSIQFNGPASRTAMAVTIANLMKDKGITADASKVEAAKTQITDLDSIYPMYQDAVATCWALGIINGTGGGKFDGNGNTERAAAATVYGRVKNVLAGAPSGGETPPATPTPPTTVSPVGTMSNTPLNLRTEAIKTHAPITYYWAQQPMEIRNISDRDSFNAACQTLKDSKMILTQGEIDRLGKNLYYNYAVVANISAATQKSVNGAMGTLLGCGGTYSSYGSSYVFYTITPLNTTTTSAPRFASTISQINANPSMTDRQKAELCVKAVCDQIDYVVDGGASWSNGLGQGDCTSYAILLNQLLSAAGLPNMNIAGTVAAGGHAWVQVKLDGTWYVMDGTITENNPNATVFTFAEHEAKYGYSGINDADMYKVARALVDAAYPTN